MAEAHKIYTYEEIGRSLFREGWGLSGPSFKETVKGVADGDKDAHRQIAYAAALASILDIQLGRIATALEGLQGHFCPSPEQLKERAEQVERRQRQLADDQKTASRRERWKRMNTATWTRLQELGIHYEAAKWIHYGLRDKRHRGAKTRYIWHLALMTVNWTSLPGIGPARAMQIKGAVTHLSEHRSLRQQLRERRLQKKG